VNIVAAFLANRIELTESGFRLDGAFPEYWSIPEIPHTVELPIGFVASLEPEEVDETFLVEIQSGSAKAGGVVASGEFMFQRPPFTKFVDNTPLYVHAAVAQKVVFTDVGAHATAIFRDGECLAAIPFGVALTPQGR